MTARSNIVFLAGVVLGAAGMAGLWVVKPREWNYAIVYQVNTEKALVVKPDGRLEFGPAYTANTLRELLEGLKQTQLELKASSICIPTRYRPPFGDEAKDGMIRVYPGTAPPFPSARLGNNL